MIVEIPVSKRLIFQFNKPTKLEFDTNSMWPENREVNSPERESHLKREEGRLGEQFDDGIPANQESGKLLSSGSGTRGIEC